MSVHVSTLPDFSPPGNLDDLTPENKTRWSRDFISKSMNSEIQGLTGGEPLTQYFNGTVTPFEVNQTGVDITWIGFPNKVIIRISSLLSSSNDV
jgi:hypothetical protein